MDDGREQREQRNWTASGERRGTVDRAGDLPRRGRDRPAPRQVGEAQSAPGRRRARLRKDARPPGDPSPPSEPLAPATKELIVHAAADAFAGCGFAGGASIGEIAAAADVSVPDVYSHFRGKAELFRAVVTSTLDSVDPLLRCGAAPTPAALHEWMDWLMSPPQLRLRALIAEINHAGVRDPEVRALFLAYGTQYGTMIAGMVGRWQADGSVDPEPGAATIARLFLAEASGLCASGALRPEMMNDPAVRDLLHRQLSCLLGESAGPSTAT